jgi:Apea-like HEPN
LIATLCNFCQLSTFKRLIAAESLFLKDKRDELTFRLAVLASKFVKNTAYTERQLYNTMIDAYGVRSDIVHGTKVRKTRLLDRNVPLSAFTDAVEEIMRCALRKATDLAHKGVKFDKDFWEALLFGENTAVAHLVVGAS